MLKTILILLAGMVFVACPNFQNWNMAKYHKTTKLVHFDKLLCYHAFVKCTLRKIFLDETNIFVYMMIQSFLNYLNRLQHCNNERIANETLSIKLTSISFAVLRENYLNSKWRLKALISLGIPLRLQSF